MIPDKDAETGSEQSGLCAPTVSEAPVPVMLNPPSVPITPLFKMVVVNCVPGAAGEALYMLRIAATGVTPNTKQVEKSDMISSFMTYLNTIIPVTNRQFPEQVVERVKVPANVDVADNVRSSVNRLSPVPPPPGSIDTLRPYPVPASNVDPLLWSSKEAAKIYVLAAVVVTFPLVIESVVL